jgi:beta-phosphoglucomutase-like phosphatase (HAD superfamily)
VEPLIARILGNGVAETMVTGDDVARLKPDPAAYQRALEQLDVRPENVLAIEDSEIGLRAATAAGVATVVVTTDYTEDQDFVGAAVVRGSFVSPQPLDAASLRRIHRQWWLRCGHPPGSHHELR